MTSQIAANTAGKHVWLAARLEQCRYRRVSDNFAVRQWRSIDSFFAKGLLIPDFCVLA